MQAYAQVIVGLAALTLLSGAALQDLRERLIANRFSILLLGLGLLWHASVAESWSSAIALTAAALAVAALVFVAGFVAWRFGGIGGGDVKLLVAASFLVGADGVISLLAGTALVGGVLALACLVWAALAPRLAAVGLALPAGGVVPSVPYGVAIAVGATWTIVPSLPFLFG